MRNKTAVYLASASLMLLIVWGKIADDLYGLPGPDSALLLFQFMLVIFLMEASITLLTFDSTTKELETRKDDLSTLARLRAMEWARSQLFNLGKLTTAAFGTSLGLLILGSLVSVSVNQIAFSGVLALVAVIAILVLLTYRRTPDDRKKRLG